MKNPVYAIFGFGGIIGHALLQHLSDIHVEDYRVYAFDHARVNIANPDHVIPLLDFIKPTVVFNCAGMSDPIQCEREPERAFGVNATGPEVLGSMCEDIGAKFVHFSSWHVFGTDSSKARNERSAVSPREVCGKSKLEGENACICFSPDSLIIRSGWLFGDGPKGHVLSWIDLAENGDFVRVRANKTVSPTYADDLVRIALRLANRKVKGVYHIANSGAATVEEVARTVLKARGLDPDLVCGIDDKEAASPWANNTSITCNKTRRILRQKVRPWQEAVDEYLAHLKSVGGT